MLQVNQNIHTSTNKGFLQESRKRRGGRQRQGATGLEPTRALGVEKGEPGNPGYSVSFVT